MSYGVKYRSTFNNELGEQYQIDIAYDGYGGAITELTASGDPLQINYLNSSEDILETVWSVEAVIQFWITDSAVSFEDFVTTKDNEIYVTVTKDGIHTIFNGFVIAEEGSQQFKDAPYLITIRCTDLINLLKTTPLTDHLDAEFIGKNSMLDYFAGCLSKANGQINIKFWCSLFHSSFNDYDDADTNTMFEQTYIESRTFLKDEKVFTDCYDTLIKLCSKHFVVFYYLGCWNVLRVADLQTTSPLRYVEFTMAGAVVSSGTGDEINAKIGKDQRIKLINGDAEKSLEYAKKRVKLSYMYEGLKNLPRNRTFRNGDPTGTTGIDFILYDIDDWDFGEVTNLTAHGGGILTASAGNAARRSVIDAYGNETESYVQIASASGEQIWLRAEAIQVKKNDKIRLSLTFKTTDELAPGNAFPLRVFVETPGGSFTRYGLDYTQNYPTSMGAARWQPGLQGVGITYTSSDLSVEWNTLNCESAPIPFDGTLYIALECQFNGGLYSYYSAFEFEYLPFVDGSYRPVKGDFNRHEQTADYKENIDDTVYISDALRAVLNGALFDPFDTMLTPTWYRFGVVESRKYTDLVSMGAFNLKWRKFRRVQGTCKGYEYEFETDNYKPFGVMTKFEFTDVDDGRQYICLNPRMNIKKGHFTGTFVEVYYDGDDGIQEGTYEFNYIF